MALTDADAAKIAVIVEMANAKYLQQTRQVSRATSSMGKKVGAATTAISGGFFAAVAAIAAIVAATKKFVNATTTQEKAERQLLTTLKSSTANYQQYFEELKKGASDIQRITTVGDEQTLQLMKMGLQMGVSAEQIQEVTKQSIGLSKALDIDLKAAMKATAMATGGNYNMLARYLPELRAATTDSEKAAIVQEKLGAAFELAKDEAMTIGGQFTQIGNTLGDMAEQAGKDLTPALSEVASIMRESAGEGGAFSVVITGISKTFAALILAVISAIRGIDNLAIKLAKLGFRMQQAGLKAKMFYMELTNQAGTDKYIETMRQLVIATAAEIDVQNQVNESNEKLKRSWTALTDIFKKNEDVTKEITGAIQGLSKATDEAGDSAGKAAKSTTDYIQGAFGQVRSYVGMVQGWQSQLVGIFSETQDRLFEQEKSRWEQRFEFLTSAFEQEREMRLEAAGVQEEDQAEIFSRELSALQTQYAKERNIKNRQAIAEQIAEKKKEKAKFDIGAEYDAKQKKMALIQDLFMRHLKVKEFNRQKQLKYAETAINMNASAMAAFGSAMTLPYPANLIAGGIAAGIALAFGGVQLGMISAQQPPAFAEGGIIPGSARGMNIIAGESGRAEAVLPLEDSRAMSMIADAMGGGDTRITLEVDGETLANVVDNRRSRRAYSMGRKDYYSGSVYA